MRTILKTLLMGAACTSVAGCQVPECKLVMTCDPPVRETVYLSPSYYSPTDTRIMYAHDGGMTAQAPVAQ